jgi:hypothetical protein
VAAAIAGAVLGELMPSISGAINDLFDRYRPGGVRPD